MRRKALRLGPQGLTAIELLIVLAVVGILAAVAFPSFQRDLERRRLESAAEAIYQLARSARVNALRTSSDLYLLSTTGANWTVWISSTFPCNPRAPQSPCLFEQAVIRGTNYPGITLSAAATTTNVRIAFRGGTVTDVDNAANKSIFITLAGTSGQQLRVSLSAEGMYKICDPNATTAFRYPPC